MEIDWVRLRRTIWSGLFSASYPNLTPNSLKACGSPYPLCAFILSFPYRFRISVLLVQNVDTAKWFCRLCLETWQLFTLTSRVQLDQSGTFQPKTSHHRPRPIPWAPEIPYQQKATTATADHWQNQYPIQSDWPYTKSLIIFSPHSFMWRKCCLLFSDTQLA